MVTPNIKLLCYKVDPGDFFDECYDVKHVIYHVLKFTSEAAGGAEPYTQLL